MNSKLTLRMDETLIQRAKAEAQRRGKSVSQMVSEYFDSLSDPPAHEQTSSPVTTSLFGILKDRHMDEIDFKLHLLDKHLESDH